MKSNLSLVPAYNTPLRYFLRLGALPVDFEVQVNHLATILRREPPNQNLGNKIGFKRFSCIFKYFQREIGLVPKPLRQIYEVFFNIFFVVVSIALTPFRTLYFKRIKSCHGCNGFSWRKMPAVSDLCLSKSTITLVDSLNGGTGISL